MGPCNAGLRVDDVGRAGAVVADMRKIIRQDPRIIQKLHRRVFIDKLTREQVRCGHKCMCPQTVSAVGARARCQAQLLCELPLPYGGMRCVSRRAA